MNPLVLAARETQTMLRTIWRNRSGAFFTILLPVMFLLLFGAINHGATVQLDPHRPPVGYTTFFTPGMLGMAIMAGTFVSLVISLAIMRDNGQLKRLRGTPLPPWAFFAGQVLSRLVLVVVEAVAVLGLGRLLFHVSLPPSADVPLGTRHLRGDSHDRGAARGHHPRWPGPRLPDPGPGSWRGRRGDGRRVGARCPPLEAPGAAPGRPEGQTAPPARRAR